jgi:tetratricopeptide (TPR) repeat protein
VTPDVLNAERVAAASLRGYLVQTLLAALAWLTLNDQETLLVEGDEDFDKILATGERQSTQVAAYAKTPSPRHGKIRHSLLGFLRTYVARRHRDQRQRFVFLATTEHPKDERPWRAAVEQAFPEIAAGEAAPEAAWIRDNSSWAEFFACVEFHFAVDNVEGLRSKLTRALGNRLRDEQPSLEPVSGLLSDRIVADLLTASTHDAVGLRTRTKADLTTILRTTREDLDAWARTPGGRRLLDFFDEARHLLPLLEDGRRVSWQTAASPAKLLLAGSEVVPFDEVARRVELDALQNFCANDDRATVLLLLGPGGIGKTRLLLEWLRRLRLFGWHTGFLPRLRLSKDLSAIAQGTTPRLVVVDYAEHRREDLRGLIAAAVQIQREGGPRLRIVLVARELADWWRALHDDSLQGDFLNTHATIRTLGATSLPYDIRVALFKSARASFQPWTIAGKETSTPDLKRPLFDRPLFILAAALAHLEGSTLEDADLLLDHVLEREMGFWRRGLAEHSASESKARILAKETVPTCLAALTLVGGVSNQEELRLLVDHVVPGVSQEEQLWIRILFRDLYGRENGVTGLEPDLLGERLVEQALVVGPNLIDRLLADAPNLHISSTLQVLGRIGTRRPTALPWLVRVIANDPMKRSEIAMDAAMAFASKTALAPVGEALAQTLQSISATADVLALAERLHNRIRHPTVSLASLGEVTARLLQDDGTRRRDLRDQARWANSRGIWLSALGRRDDALAITQKAVGLYSALAREEPGTFLPAVAGSLMNLGSRLTDLGRRAEALAAATEAVRIWRAVDEMQAAPFRRDLATALNNLGIAYTALGRPAEGLSVIEEAVQIWRALAQEQADVFLPDLAMALNNLGNALGELGQREEALRVGEETLRINRMLAETRPDAFLSGLAEALNNQGNRLGDLGRDKEALAVTDEAIQIRRDLAQARPDVFLPVLAGTLGNRGNWLSALGRREEAMTAAEEAAQIYRTLADRWPDRFAREFAGALSNFSNRLVEAGRQNDALKPATDALAMRRELAKALPDVYVPDVAGSLTNLGAILTALGRGEDALRAADEAVETYRRLAQSQPDAFLPSLARSLGLKGSALRLLNRSSDAVQNLGEGVQVLTPLAARYPSALRMLLRTLLDGYLDAAAHAGMEPDHERILEARAVLGQP